MTAPFTLPVPVSEWAATIVHRAQAERLHLQALSRLTTREIEELTESVDTGAWRKR